jgi:CspA family cold shock protein
MKGTIKWYNYSRGYGFILGEDGKDVFVHRTGLTEGTDITENDNVEYELETTDRGPSAIKVKKIPNA